MSEAQRIRDEKAHELLQQAHVYPGLVDRPAREAVLVTWQYPALGSYSSWTLFHGADRYHLRRIVWERSADCMPGLPGPTMYGAESELAPATAEQALEALRRIKLPLDPAPDPGIGIDGVIYGIRLGHARASWKIEWWCEPPPGWEALKGWFRETVGGFEQRLPHHKGHGLWLADS